MATDPDKPDLSMVGTDDLWLELKSRFDGAVLIYDGLRIEGCPNQIGVGLHYFCSVPHLRGLMEYGMDFAEKQWQRVFGAAGGSAPCDVD